MIAHVLTGSPVPLALQWLAAGLLFGGALGAVALHSRRRRAVALALGCAGLGGTVASLVLAAVQPGPAPYAIRIAAPLSGSTVSSPVVLTVCGVLPDGSSVDATDSQHYLVVFVDGHEVPTVDVWRFAERLTPGEHALRVELVTPQHHAFNPPATASATVTVAAGAPGTPTPSC